MSRRGEALCGSLTGETGPGGEQGGDITVVPREDTDSFTDSLNLKRSDWAVSWTPGTSRSGSAAG